MSAITPPIPVTPIDVVRASERDAKRYELIDGELKEKKVGFEALFIAGMIQARLNTQYLPHTGFAVVGGMVYCFSRKNHGRKPDVA